jgi:hydroxymethylglutaryl-CoA lyase
VQTILEALTADVQPDRIALHFHDTRGMAVANVLAALPFGVRTFDAAAGGLGGCPYAPGASGNVATEDLLYMLEGMGYRTGVSLAAVADASAPLAPAVGHALPSRYLQARLAAMTPPRDAGSS